MCLCFRNTLLPSPSICVRLCESPSLWRSSQVTSLFTSLTVVHCKHTAHTLGGEPTYTQPPRPDPRKLYVVFLRVTPFNRSARHICLVAKAKPISMRVQQHRNLRAPHQVLMAIILTHFQQRRRHAHIPSIVAIRWNVEIVYTTPSAFSPFIFHTDDEQYTVN